jgi:PAT family beta-lactamase induction signal transducer AmpG
VGLGGAAFVAYQSKQADRRFTAMQLALFTSLMSIPRNLTGAMAGFLIEGAGWSSFAGIGYPRFFLLCALTAIPGMLLLFKVAPWNEKETTTSAERSS